MPFNTIKILNDRTGKEMTLSEMEVYLEGMMKKQMTDLLQSADNKTFTYKDDNIQKGYLVKKKIIEDYNGCIWLESFIGEGSKFYFSIRK